MADIAPTVPIDIARTVQFTARSTTTGAVVTGSTTVKCTVVKQSSPVEYWNGSAWVTGDPGAQAMTEDATISGAYEDGITYDEAGVDYIIRCWDSTAGNNVSERHGRVRGRQADVSDRVCAVTVTVKETDAQGDAVPDVTVVLQNTDGTEVSRDATDSNGAAAGLGVAGAASYTVVMIKSGWTLANQTLTVSAADITTGSKSVEYYGTEYATAAPSTPGTCAIEGWLYDASGTAIVGRSIEVILAEGPQVAAHIYYIAEESALVTDSNGKFRVVGVQGLTLTIQSINASNKPDGAVKRTITVPELTTAYLDDIAEAY